MSSGASLRTKLAAGVLSLSVAGIAFIQGWEGTSQEAYLDAVGVPTICTGSTRGVFIGQHASLAECETRLLEDSSYAGRAVARHVQGKLTQEQYDALVSLVFNIGEGNFARSTLLKRLNAGQCRVAADEFRKWVYAGGKRLRGLVSRREAERALFLKGCE